jgi:hypothetical protein
VSDWRRQQAESGREVLVCSWYLGAGTALLLALIVGALLAIRFGHPFGWWR